MLLALLTVGVWIASARSLTLTLHLGLTALVLVYLLSFFLMV